MSKFFMSVAVCGSMWISLFAMADVTMINGAGATFPYPLYSKWFSEYKKIDANTQVNYSSIGSGGGIRQFLDQTVDFGASDAPMTDEQMSKAKTPILHIPTVLGAVVLSYNIPDVKTKIKLTPEIIVDMYTGKITKWNDPKIKKENPSVKFPESLYVMPIYRSDGSGTTGIFTDYLSKAVPAFKTEVGQGTSVSWKAGLGGRGNEGVTGLIKQTPGAIGYVELVYAESNQLSVASIKNSSGKFIEPSVKSVTAAATGALKTIPEDFRVSITNSSGKDAYPIAGFTYLLVSQKMKKDKGQKIVDLLNWALGAGQKMAEPLFYAPLPSSLVGKVKAKVKTIQLE